MERKIRTISEKAVTKALVILVICYLIADVLDCIEPGAGTLPLIFGFSYFAVFAWRGGKLMYRLITRK